MRDRSFVALCALILVNNLGFGLIAPVLPAFARSFGLGAADVGLVIGIYGFARFLANVPAGQLAERRGRRTVLIVGTAITSVSALLIITSQNLPQMLAYRLLAGVGAATVVTGGQIMVSDIASPENRGRMMSTYQGFFLLGSGLGPVPGGFLADAFGLRMPFVAYAVANAMACTVALLMIRETRPAPAEVMVTRDVTAVSTTVGVMPTLMTPAFMLIGFLSFAQTVARTGAIFTIIPLLGAERVGLSASQIGLAMTTINMLNIGTVLQSGKLSDRFGRKPVIAPATIVAGLSLALFAWSPTYLVFLASAALWGFGSGLGGPAPAAYVTDLSPVAVRGRVFGFFRSVADAGYVVGPLLLGFLADRAGYGVPLLVTAVMIVGSGALFWLFAPELYRPRRAGALEPTRAEQAR